MCWVASCSSINERPSLYAQLDHSTEPKGIVMIELCLSLSLLMLLATTTMVDVRQFIHTFMFDCYLSRLLTAASTTIGNMACDHHTITDFTFATWPPSDPTIKVRRVRKARNRQSSARCSNKFYITVSVCVCVSMHVCFKFKFCLWTRSLWIEKFLVQREKMIQTEHTGESCETFETNLVNHRAAAVVRTRTRMALSPLAPTTLAQIYQVDIVHGWCCCCCRRRSNCSRAIPQCSLKTEWNTERVDFAVTLADNALFRRRIVVYFCLLFLFKTILQLQVYMHDHSHTATVITIRPRAVMMLVGCKNACHDLDHDQCVHHLLTHQTKRCGSITIGSTWIVHVHHHQDWTNGLEWVDSLVSVNDTMDTLTHSPMEERSLV